MLEDVDMLPQPPYEDTIINPLFESNAQMENADSSTPAAAGRLSSGAPSAPLPPNHGASDSPPALPLLTPPSELGVHCVHDFVSPEQGVFFTGRTQSG